MVICAEQIFPLCSPALNALKRNFFGSEIDSFMYGNECGEQGMGMHATGKDIGDSKGSHFITSLSASL